LDGSGTYINEVLGILSASDPRVAFLWQNGVGGGILPFGALTPAQFQALSVCPAGNPLCPPGGLPGYDPNAKGATVGYSANPNYKNPYTVQASLGIDRQLGKTYSISLGYNMYHGVHLQMPVDTGLTQISPGNPLCAASVNGAGACTDQTGGPLYTLNST